MKLSKAAMTLLLAFSLFVTPALAVPEDADEAVNAPPVAENMELETYRGVSVGGQLCAHDPEGDAVTFEVTTDPMKGTVELAPDGHFVYTPKENKRGKDYFGFRAVDALGGQSQEGTVIIRLIRQKTKLTYADMAGDGAEYAAVALTEAGIFTAEQLGTDYVFHPDDTVSRGEFLSMCMTAADCRLLKGVSSTGFLDDGDIDAWLKPYVATALMGGYVRGSRADSGAVFRPADDITMRQACVMLNAVLGVTDVVSVAAYTAQPETEGSQAVANLTACHVIPAGWDDLDVVLTRADTACLLQNAMGLLQKR